MPCPRSTRARGRLHRFRLQGGSAGGEKEGLVDAVDAFCERIAFTAEQTRRVFETARALGLPVSCTRTSSRTWAARRLRRDTVRSRPITSNSRMQRHLPDARAGTVAVLLPGAFYFLRGKQLPPIGALRRHGVPIALATDHNPGSSPLSSPLLVLNMACTLFGLTPEEALAGMTRNAARALGLQASHGTLEVGKTGRSRPLGDRRTREPRPRLRRESLHEGLQKLPELRPDLGCQVFSPAERRSLLHIDGFGELELDGVDVV